MNRLDKIFATIGFVLLVANPTAADTKNYPKLIVGTWKVTKADENTVPQGAVFEMGADGKLKIRISPGDQELVLDGTYRVEGSSLTINVRVGDQEGKTKKLEIRKLDESSLILADSEKNSAELKRS